MAYRLFQSNAKYYRVVDGIRNFEQVPLAGELPPAADVRSLPGRCVWQ